MPVSEHQGHQAGISALAHADTHGGATLPLLASEVADKQEPIKQLVTITDSGWRTMKAII